MTNRDREKYEDEFLAPDGGFWAWAVCLGSFSCNLILDGIVYSFGILLLPLMEYFDSPSSTVALVGSLLPGVYMCAGPLVAGFVNVYGCRPVCMIGGLLSCIAVLLSTLSPNIYVLMFTFGILGGVGVGLTYLPAVVACGYYFNKRRALATSIAVCGSSFGCFVFAPLASFLLNYYGSWKSVHVIFAGLLLNCCVFGAFMRPLKTRKKPVMSRKPGHPRMVEILKEEEVDFRNASGRRTTIATDALDPFLKVEHICRNVSTSKLETMNQAESLIIRPLSRKDIFYSGSIQRLSSRGNSVLSLSPIKESGFKMALREMVDFNNFKNPLFVLICASNTLAFLAMYIPYIYLPNMISKVWTGESYISMEQASFVVSSIGISNTIGRIIIGWITDFPCVDSLLVTNASLSLSGICVSIFPICSNYESFLVIGLCLGFSLSGYISLTSIVLADMFGLDSLTSTFGSLVMFRGIASMLGPPIAGAINEAAGFYDPAFYVAGSCFIIAGALGQFAYYLKIKWADKTNISKV